MIANSHGHSVLYRFCSSHVKSSWEKPCSWLSFNKLQLFPFWRFNLMLPSRPPPLWGAPLPDKRPWDGGLRWRSSEPSACGRLARSRKAAPPWDSGLCADTEGKKKENRNCGATTAAWSNNPAPPPPLQTRNSYATVHLNRLNEILMSPRRAGCENPQAIICWNNDSGQPKLISRSTNTKILSCLITDKEVFSCRNLNKIRNSASWLTRHVHCADTPYTSGF